MANFSALKTAIQNAIRQNGNEEITGDVLQQILLSVVNTMGDGAINTIEQNLSNETQARQNADTTLQSNINAEALTRGNADTQLQNAINAIKANIDNGYVYAGIATPSSTPVSGKVFYIATADGTYTKFGGQVLTQGVNILRFNGSAWSSQQLIGIDDVPTAGSNSLVKSGGVQNELALGAVYDVSAKNPTGGPNSDGKWESLSALLSDANLNTLIPTAYRKGGMSVKFVHTSDKKYVQYRCMADSFTTDTTQWAIADEGVYVENPEFIKTELDAEQKLLGGIKKDGAYWFNKIESPTLDNLQKEVNDAIEESQETLIEHYDYYNVSKHHTIRDVFNIYTANTGWQQVEYDSTAAMYDELDVYQIGEVCNYGGDTEHSYEALISQRGVAPAIVTQEYVTRRKFTLDEAISLLPVEILTAFAAGQMICFADLDDIVEEWQLSESGSWVRVNPYEIKDPEGRVEIKLDNDNKIIAYRKADGTWVECVGIEAPNLGDYVDKEEGKGLINSEYAESVDVIEDPEERLSIELDTDKKILSYRDKDGVKYEEMLKVNHFTLTNEGMNEFQQALKDAGFTPGGGGDWSDREVIELPEPKHYALLNINIGSLPTESGDVREAAIQYYDGLGNYFKMDAEIEIQGQTSRIFAKTGGKGNYTLDLPKDVKFGKWVPQDSFHLKGCAKDVVRGILPTSYKWAYLVQEYLNAKPNRVLVDESGITETNATGKRINDWPTDARCLPDGFPCEVYVNGEYWGLYSWQLKKHRKNYSMDKKDYTSFFLDADAMMTDDYTHGIWNDGPDDKTYRATGWWTGFDIKGPKDLICMDGSEFDGDHPKELIDSTSEYYDSSNKKHKGSAQTKALIRTFSTRYNEVKALIAADNTEAAKVKFNEYFDYDACMLVYIYNCLMKNGDSIKKNTLWGMYGSGKIFPALWDLDGMYGTGWVGDSAGSPSSGLWNGAYATAEWPLKLFKSLYDDEIKAAYSSLREAKVISLETWHDIVFNQWVNRIGEEAYNRDIKKWPETPSYRENYTDTEHWRQIGWTSAPGSLPVWTEGTTYNQGTRVVIKSHPAAGGGYVLWMIYEAIQTTNTCPVTKFYTEFPVVGGFYDSPKRWKKWIDKQIVLCDVQNDYNLEDILADFIAYRNTDTGYEIACTNMSITSNLTKDYNYIQGHITRHESIVEGQTISTYTIDNGAETPEDVSKTYTTVRAAIEAAESQPVDVPSENVYYIQARAKNINYYKK